MFYLAQQFFFVFTFSFSFLFFNVIYYTKPALASLQLCMHIHILYFMQHVQDNGLR